MVRHGIRGAVIALVGGTAVATAMGVLSQSRSGGSLAASVSTPSQRVSYKIDYSPAVVPQVRAAQAAPQGTGVLPTLPDFMTRDVSMARPVAVGARLAAETSMQTLTLPSNAMQPLATNFAAGASSGQSGGFAVGYNGRVSEQSTLDADLAQSAPASQSMRLGSQAGFSRSPSTNGGFKPSDLLAFSGPDVQDLADASQSSPAQTNSTASGSVGPKADAKAPPLVSNAAQNAGSASGTPGSAASSSPVPTPGVAGIIGAAGVRLARRRR